MERQQSNNLVLQSRADRCLQLPSHALPQTRVRSPLVLQYDNQQLLCFRQLHVALQKLAVEPPNSLKIQLPASVRSGSLRENMRAERQQCHWAQLCRETAQQNQ